MSPQININAETLSRLQKHAVPLVDNFDTIICRLIDAYEGAPHAADSESEGPYLGGAATNLTYTKVLTASINGVPVASEWNGLMREAIRLVGLKHPGDLEAVKTYLTVKYAVGEVDTPSHYFVPEAGITVQGQNANGAWKATSHILKRLKLPAQVSFVWYDNEKAARPGEHGVLTIP